MNITDSPELLKTILQGIRNRVTKPRDGIHLSDLNFCLRKAYFRKMGLSPPPSDDQCILYMTGYSFQEYMFGKGERTLEVDGINCTPDVAEQCLEVKSTRQSSRNFDFMEMQHWQSQILGYMKALDTTEYSLVVLFVVGNYGAKQYQCPEGHWQQAISGTCPLCGKDLTLASGKYFPQLRSYTVTATPEEVADNWNALLQKRDTLVEALRVQAPPPPNPMDWEGAYCENILFCKDSPCHQ